MRIQSSLSQVAPQQVRHLLSGLLRSDADLEAFCLDCFQEIYQRFGSGMNRMQKENLLILHAQTLADIVYALQRRFPHATVWNTWPMESCRLKNDRLHGRPGPPSRKLLALSTAAASSICMLGWLSWPLMHPTVQQLVYAAEPAGKTGCGALAMDDVFLIKSTDPAHNQQLVLDVRLRYRGTAPNVANITRAVLTMSDKTFQRTPYSPSASYDLLITGERSEAALAQRVGPGEVDRIALRLGFTPESASYQYIARLQLLYNGSCSVESAPFILSSDVVQWPGEMATREH